MSDLTALCLSSVFTAGFVYEIIKAFRTGTIPIAVGQKTNRAENPISFWVMVFAFSAVALLGMLMMGIALKNMLRGVHV